MTPPVVAAEGKRVGVLIVPAVDKSGAVEDLCLESLKGTLRLQLAEEYIARFQDSDLPMPDRPQKAVVQSYLAAQKKIARTITVGFDMKYFDISHEAFIEARQFLSLLADIH